MKKSFNQSLVLLFFSISFFSYSQKPHIIGLWEVNKVSVGKKNVTPVAKWTKINKDGTFQSGNGWLQHSKGIWNYDRQNNIFSTTDSLAVFDEFGGFTISFENKKMIWKRNEKGMSVKVILSPIKELPMSSSDYLKGIWDLVELKENGKSILHDFDSENRHNLFIGWDRVYINFTPTGKKLRGYWHIHGHRPEITLLPHQQGREIEKWRIEVTKKELVMIGISNSNRKIQRKYIRKKTF